MTYSQKANLNATDSELDAKRIVYPDYRGLPDFNEKLSPTEDKIIQALCQDIEDIPYNEFDDPLM